MATCRNCHTGGTAPTLTLTGPASIAAGAVASYQLDVQTNAARGQGVVSATTGVELQPLQNFSRSFDELVPNGIRPPQGGRVVYRFSVKAPAAGSITLYYGALAANGNGTGGDGFASGTRTVTVTGTADAGVPDSGPPPVDSGLRPPDSGASPDAGSPPASDSGSAPPGRDGGSGGQPSLPGDEAGGCSLGPTSAPDALLALPLLALSALGLRRRRERT